tara:strand:+ start:330 stop:773 length:444 start_codon:yes stop_codon:yes gene_type:complete
MFDDTLFVLLEEYQKGGNINKDVLNLCLRKYDDILISKHGVWLSEKARCICTINKVTSLNSKPKGLHLEHIIPVRDRLEALIYLYRYKNVRSKKDLSKFIEQTFYAVFKHAKKEKNIEEYEAESLLLEKHKTSNKIKYINEIYSIKR